MRKNKKKIKPQAAGGKRQATSNKPQALDKPAL